VYDTAARAEREHRCFNVFCAEQTRSRDAMASMKRDVAALLHRCDAIVAYNGIRHAVNSEVAAEHRAWWRGRSGRRRACRVRHDRRRIQVSVLVLM